VAFLKLTAAMLIFAAVYFRVTLITLFFCSQSFSQTIGGSTVFSFLNLPNTPQLTALGGVNVSNPANDVGMAYYNPALLKQSMHTQVNVVFNDFYAGIKTYHFSSAYHAEKLKANFSYGLHYFDYGDITQTDAAGNIFGQLRPVDFTMQVSASHHYKEKWNAGATVKYISSNYGQYKANGLAMDIGLLYSDTAKLFNASVLVKNAGFQLRKYNGSRTGDLPFDLQAGVTQRLKNAPFSFSFTGHHLNVFDISYNDTLFNNTNDFDSDNKKFSFDKVFRHIVIATTIHVDKKLEATIGYNHLRRKELNIGKDGNGLNGFSVGVAVLLNKIQFRFSRANYQNNTAYNQLGLNLKLNDYFGLGKFGKQIGW
jgi:hypothetical protein